MKNNNKNGYKIVDIWIVIENMGDGSNALRYFPTRESAEEYMDIGCVDSVMEFLRLNPRHFKAVRE